MCARCDELEAEVAYLREQLGGTADTVANATLRERLRLSRNEAWLLLSLYRAEGRVVTKDVLIGNMPTRLDDGLDRDLSQITTVVCKTRQRTGYDWIANVWGDGYKLTETGRAKVAEALA